MESDDCSQIVREPFSPDSVSQSWRLETLFNPWTQPLASLKIYTHDSPATSCSIDLHLHWRTLVWDRIGSDGHDRFAHSFVCVRDAAFRSAAGSDAYYIKCCHCRSGIAGSRWDGLSGKRGREIIRKPTRSDYDTGTDCYLLLHPFRRHGAYFLLHSSYHRGSSNQEKDTTGAGVEHERYSRTYGNYRQSGFCCVGGPSNGTGTRRNQTGGYSFGLYSLNIDRRDYRRALRPETR